MKKLIIAIGITIPLLFSPALAKEKCGGGNSFKIYDKNNQLQGKITKDGNIYDKNNQLDGKITRDGTIYDKNNQIKGKLKR